MAEEKRYARDWVLGNPFRLLKVVHHLGINRATTTGRIERKTDVAPVNLFVRTRDYPEKRKAGGGWGEGEGRYQR